MSNSDSFINEVTEEVRRDQLYGLIRKWAWLAILIVLVLVGGAAYFEWTRTQERNAAQAFGNALVSALEAETPEARIAGLEEISAPGPQGEILLAMLAAGVAVDGEGAEAAAARLRSAAEGPDLPRRYRDLALLRAEMMDPSDPAEARLILGALATPGAPYSALAEEQLALIDIREGDLEAGLDRLRSIERSAAATPGLQQRASQLIVALEAGSELVDTLPEPEPDPVPETPDETSGGAVAPVEETEDPADEAVGADAAGGVDPAEDEAADEGAADDAAASGTQEDEDTAGEAEEATPVEE